MWESAVRNVWWATADCDRTRRFEEPPILILDEATSAVDNETEAAIQRSLERITLIELRCDRSSPFTVRNADCIYVIMEQGKLVEWGRMNNCSNRYLCQPLASAVRFEILAWQ